MRTDFVLTWIVFLTGIPGISGNCGTHPKIKNTDKNVWVSYSGLEKVVEFACLKGYDPIGNKTFICSDGIWTGGPFSCQIKECPSLKSPEHGKRIGDNFEVGSVIGFKCNIGYDIDGLNTRQCQVDSTWKPPHIPECRRKKCPSIPSVENGRIIQEQAIEGQRDVYGAILRVKCDDGYLIHGPIRFYCDGNGQWTKIPTCKAVLCPSYPNLDAKCVERSTLTLDNSFIAVLIIHCTEHAKFEGESSASCVNNSWSDLSMRCYCDCVIKADTPHVQVETDFLKHGETLNWTCSNGTRKKNTASLTCFDGSVGTPLCFHADINGTDIEKTSESGHTDKTQKLPLLWIILPLCAVLIGILVVISWKCFRKRDHTKSIKKDTCIEEEKSLTGDGTYQNGSHVTSNKEAEKLTESELAEKRKENKTLKKERKKLKNSKLTTYLLETKVTLIEHQETATPGKDHLKDYKPTRTYAKSILSWMEEKRKKKPQKTRSQMRSQDLKDENEAPPLKRNGIFRSPTESQAEDRQSETKDIGNICPNCNQPVYAKEEMLACGRKWHMKCYKCKTCEKSLNSRIMNEHDCQIYCTKCYSGQFGLRRLNTSA